MTKLLLNIPAILLAQAAKNGSPLDFGILTLIFSLVAVFLLILILVFLRVRVVRFFRLSYISLIYGQYSYEYINFFKENNLRSPYNGCIKDELTLHLLVFYRKIKNSLEFTTGTTIDFGEIPFMSGTKHLFKRKGNPGCMKVATVNDIKFIVAGYNETLQGLKMKSLYFFVNGHFVMGEFLFSDMLRVVPSKLVETLSLKYLNGTPVEKEVFYITDQKGNQLNYEFNGFTISVKYLFTGDAPTNAILSSLLVTGENLTGNNLINMRNEDLLNHF